MKILGNFFGIIMNLCFQIVHNYGITIILFTFITKIILLPISILVQKNSIKMVKMYPKINTFKAKYWGNQDIIAEKQYNLYKEEKYHPLLDLIPPILQIFILMGVINVLYEPHLHLTSSPDVFIFCGINMEAIPFNSGKNTLLIPVLAAISSWLMCAAQNHSNVLQSEQGKANKIITLSISVGLSLYLGFFVPAGVGFYWTVSNLMAIALLYILNYFINPKKYIDYNALEESKIELKKAEQYASHAKRKQDPKYAALEKKDYKRFLKYDNKQLVFYSEGKGFYKYFQNVIELILKRTDIIIHYITSDPLDDVLKLQSENFQVYYISENKLIVLMMKMDADMVVMTMPDLQRYHIKRSLVREDIEYVYMDHGIGSVNLMLRKHALDYFDTIFASNDIAYAEIRAQEKQYGLKEKTIIKYGFGLIDNMIMAYNTQTAPPNNQSKLILIAPSWQEQNLLDLYIDEILQNILKEDYQVILRPHPQYVRYFKDKLLDMEKRYSSYSNFTLQLDFSSNNTVFNADILITDWSGIAYEYTFTTLKPTLFINTPMKIMNPDYEEINVTPFDLEIRDKAGISLEPEQIGTINDKIQMLLNDTSYSKETMLQMREKYLYNVSHSAEIGADYIIKRLIEISKMS